MTNETKREVVLITGANGALGAALVARCAADGAQVIALERSKTSEPTLAHEASNVLRLRASTSDGAALTSALARAEAEVGALTGAVLTAGAWRGGHKFHEPDAVPDYEAVMAANMEPTTMALRAVLPGLVKRRHGSVVLIGSRSGARPYSAPGDAAYAAAKAALTALAQAVAAECLQDGVRINVVLPSTIDTAANRQAMPNADHSRWVTTDSLGDVIRFLLSPQSRDVSGAALPVYGRAGV